MAMGNPASPTADGLAAGAAEIVCCAAPLARVADAVAALSCEAVRWDSAAAFDAPASGYSTKDQADVAADLKMLLRGPSRLAGSREAGGTSTNSFAGVPTVHGNFRQAVRALDLDAGQGKEDVLMLLATQFATSAHFMCKMSAERARFCAGSIADARLREELVAAGGADVGDLKGTLAEMITDSDAVTVLRRVHEQLLKLRGCLAWEAAVAMAVIETAHSTIQKPRASVDGNSSVLMLLRDHVTDGKDVPGVNSELVKDWRTKLWSLFDPRRPEFESLMEKLKGILEEKKEKRRLPKIPKGTRDFAGRQMAIRERAFSIITGVFKMHGGVALDTPVFELRETLMSKYGEDSKLIYDLADQGGELCSLRYDLTVPFARYLAMNNHITTMRRYQIAKVYRRDRPSKGRYREFYQCDFDIAGVYEPMQADFEVIKVLTELLDKLDIGMYEIKLNHRKLLDGMLEICGVPPEKFRTVCSSIDKLDKLTFEEVKKEMVEEKGVSDETAEKIGNLVKTRGPPLQVLMELRKEGSKFIENDGSVVALNELEILFKALEKANAIDVISFDLSLARGLDYYTGVIYEAVFKGTTQVGSIAAGGRYDNLVGDIVAGKQVPAVGVSLGMERVFAIMEEQEKEKNQETRTTETEVLLSILGKDLTLAAELASELWRAEIKAEIKLSTRVQDHIRYATQSGIPWMVIVGQSEIRDGKVKLKNISARQEEEVPRKDFAHVLKQRLTNP
ncbi:histidine--tRNA ligase, cytoplasmic-like [Lolium rigidum]|uniref:histidine--tRNA ligase, cytoplasmic-like n=1 Tax=Lolium rigidum TaxID=89674 RepID=UPI001F5CC6CD|nr:histidine--tRNA ligase, cytoplasmic-like [Lolium rigidum]